MRLQRAALLAAVPALLAGSALALDRAFPPDLARAERLSPALSGASGEVVNLRPASDGAIRLAPAQMGGDIVPLLLAREDRRFWMHPGVDPLALLRAAAQFARRGRVVSGGSTLAMQVAHLLEPHPRTVTGKLHDILRALQLEAHLGRAGVLRLYLTLAPMGGNIEGFRAASLLYFGREPAALSRQQAALLVSLPQSPARRRPDRHPQAAWRSAARVLAAAGDVPVPLPAAPVARAPLPALAAHLAEHFSGQSTLDGALQAQVEALARRELLWIGPDADMAAIVVRNSDRAVLAYLGGARFFGRAGMVDMARAPRSPGSALKPFIYAMAFDAGLATPDTLVDDTELRLGTYAPRDFDRAEHAQVTAAEALRNSLNRPAVRLLALLGPRRFAAALQAAGVRLQLPRGAEPSAALALGGEGITPLGLAALYADLADAGRVAPLHWTGPGQPERGALVSPRAAAQVARILRGQPPPPGLADAAVHPVAYKTGTSFGFRDAWAGGFSPRFTVVVWVGRRDGSPRPGAIGRDVAAPVLFRIFGLLPPEPPVQDQGPPVPAAALAPALLRMTARARLQMLFPPDHVELAFDPAAPLGLRAIGGTPPYSWTADGLPVATGRDADWQPSGPGFAHLTVTDRAGGAVSADVRLVAE